MYCVEVLNWPSCVESGVFLKWANWNAPQVELCVKGVTWWRQRWRATNFTHTHTYVCRVLTSKWWCWVWENCFPWLFQPYTTSTPFLFLKFTLCFVILSSISLSLLNHLISFFFYLQHYFLLPSVRLDFYKSAYISFLSLSPIHH